MAGRRGKQNPMPKAGRPQQNIFSREGKQATPPLGDGFKPQMTARAMDKPRKGPVKRDNMLKG